MDTQQTNQGQPRAFFFIILFYIKSYFFVSCLIDMSFFITSSSFRSSSTFVFSRPKSTHPSLGKH
jgi:hypothetical protein